MKKTFHKKLGAKLCGMSTIIIMVFILVFFTVINQANGVNFLTPSNISTIVNQASFLIIVGIGQAITILVGGINLSMGAVMAFTTVLCGGMLLKSSTVPIGIPIVLVLLIGAFIGFLNGLMVTKLNIPPFISTFAMMYACRGLAWVYLRNRVLYSMDEGFRTIATGNLFNIGGFAVKMPMLIALLALLLFYIMLKHTSLGRKFYFTGANPTAARFSGINTDRITILAYVISSLLAAFAGLMYVARLNSAEPGLAGKAHFEAITVSLIGGFSMAGGYGNIWGIAGGAVVVYTIQAGMNSLQIPSEYQTLVNGALIIISVCVNQILMNKKMHLENDLCEELTEQKAKKKAQKLEQANANAEKEEI